MIYDRVPNIKSHKSSGKTKMTAKETDEYMHELLNSDKLQQYCKQLSLNVSLFILPAESK
jgi:hypothetical protein